MTRDSAKRMHHRMVAAYDLDFTSELSRAIYHAFKETDDATYEAAVEAHLSDPEFGGRPPSVPQLQVHAERLGLVRRREAKQESFNRTMANFDRGVEPPDAYGIPKPRAWFVPNCPKCDDTGLAHFWFNDHDHREVYCYPDDPPLLPFIKIASAVCTCSVGMAKPDRQWMTDFIKLKDGSFCRGPVVARLEICERLVAVWKQRATESWHDNA